jgi:hypothetical protein
VAWATHKLYRKILETYNSFMVAQKIENNF